MSPSHNPSVQWKWIFLFMCKSLLWLWNILEEQQFLSSCFLSVVNSCADQVHIKVQVIKPSICVTCRTLEMETTACFLRQRLQWAPYQKVHVISSTPVKCFSHLVTGNNLMWFVILVCSPAGSSDSISSCRRTFAFLRSHFCFIMFSWRQKKTRNSDLL